MKIEREDFLRRLQMAKSGLSTKPLLQQSASFILEGGYITTFNDEVSCQIRMCSGNLDEAADFNGAVPSNALLSVLDRCKDEILLTRVNENGELEFRGKNKGFAVTFEKDIFLPIDRVDPVEKGDWMKMPEGLIDAVRLVQRCVGSDQTRFLMTCIHLAPKFVEACDNTQALRCRVDTGLEDSVLVRGDSFKDLVHLNVTHMAQTQDWLHFRTSDNLLYSCRHYKETYPNLDPVIQIKGKQIQLPKGVVEATDRASVFAADRVGSPLVRCDLSENNMRLTARGLTGWYKEDTEVDYSGPDLEFAIAPDLLKHICENYASVTIQDGKMKAMSSHSDKQPWEYVTVLGSAVEPDPDSGGEEEADENGGGE